MPDTTNKMAAAGFAQGAKKYQQFERTVERCWLWGALFQAS